MFYLRLKIFSSVWERTRLHTICCKIVLFVDSTTKIMLLFNMLLLRSFIWRFFKNINNCFHLSAASTWRTVQIPTPWREGLCRPRHGYKSSLPCDMTVTSWHTHTPHTHTHTPHTHTHTHTHTHAHTHRGGLSPCLSKECSQSAPHPFLKINMTQSWTGRKMWHL